MVKPALKLLLAGDVMIGRGIDQVLPHPADPKLQEPMVCDARDYIRFAEARHGPIPMSVPPSYPWGESLAFMDASDPDFRIINLETAITSASSPWPQKSIHYRMNPSNINCLMAARIDACCLANNHVLDWGWNGLAQTLHCLKLAGISSVGAGLNPHQAQSPAVFDCAASECPNGRLLLFSLALPSSGCPINWSATFDRPGIALLPNIDKGTARWLSRYILKHRHSGDRLVLSLHWGANWVQSIPEDHLWFARTLIDLADVDIIFGHSSHHPLPVEIYHNKLILYGCGDLLNDYEGIIPSSHRLPSWRSDLGCLYSVRLDCDNGHLLSLDIKPWLIRRFQLQRPAFVDQLWLEETLKSSSIQADWHWLQTSSGGLVLQPLG